MFNPFRNVYGTKQRNYQEAMSINALIYMSHNVH